MSTPQPAPGWYPDPSGGGSRWWDGRGWTDHRGPGTPPLVRVSPPPSAPGAPTGTVWAYLQAVLPVLSALALTPYLLSFQRLFTQQLTLMGRVGGSGRLPPEAVHALLSGYADVFGAFGVSMAFSLVVAAAWVVLAVLDVRELRRRGIAAPFHWAWSFLSIVYPIGRAVVVRRRTGRGLGPLWLLIATYAGSVVALSIVTSVLLASVFSALPAQFPSGITISRTP